MTQHVMTLTSGVDLVEADPFDQPAPPPIQWYAVAPVAPCRAIIPASGAQYPLNLNPEINDLIERRFTRRVHDAIHDEAVAQVNERMGAIEQALREKIAELDCAVAAHQDAANQWRTAADNLRKSQRYEPPSGLCTPSRNNRY